MRIQPDRCSGPNQAYPARCLCQKKEKRKGKTRLFDALDPLKHILLVAYVKKVVSPLRVEDPEGKWPIRNARVKRDS